MPHLSRPLTVCLLAIIVLSPTALSDSRVPGDFASIQDAIDREHARGGGAVFIASGVYLENLKLHPGVKLIGLEDRFGHGPRIEPANATEPIVWITGPEGRSRRTLRRLTLANGRALLGAAIAIRDRAAPILEKCELTLNRSRDGAAIQIWARCNLEATDCLFRGNIATGRGGAIQANASGGPIRLRSCVFEDNLSVEQGGAIHVDDRVLTIEHCRFERNRTGGEGGAIRARSLFFPHETLTLRNSQLTRNEAKASGGAVSTLFLSTDVSGSHFQSNRSSGRGGAVEVLAGLFSNHRDNDFEGNLGGEGGAISLVSTSCSLSSERYLDNFGRYSGGAVHVSGDAADVTLDGLDLRDNRGSGGGAIYCGANGTVDIFNCVMVRNTAANGCGLLLRGCESPSISNNTIVSNRLLDGRRGEGIRIDVPGAFAGITNNWIVEHRVGIQGAVPHDGRLWIVANRFWNNGLDWLDVPADPRLNHSDQAPGFVNPGVDFHLLPGSPGIDEGVQTGRTPEVDIDGRPRPVGKGMDIGADEVGQ